MTLKKRGLGRGLEALLADDFANEEIQQPTKTEVSYGEPQLTVAVESVEADKQAAMVVAFFKEIQKERHTLLEEAENLRKLIEDFESIIRADLS